MLELKLKKRRKTSRILDMLHSTLLARNDAYAHTHTQHREANENNGRQKRSANELYLVASP
eukprot:184146-Pyramimonas_sp.AAC.1